MTAKSSSPHVPDTATLARAMERANAWTILRHRRLGMPLVIWEDGQIKKVSADDYPLPVPEEELGENPGYLGIIL